MSVGEERLLTVKSRQLCNAPICLSGVKYLCLQASRLDRALRIMVRAVLISNVWDLSFERVAPG